MVRSSGFGQVLRGCIGVPRNRRGGELRVWTPCKSVFLRLEWDGPICESSRLAEVTKSTAADLAGRAKQFGREEYEPVVRIAATRHRKSVNGTARSHSSGPAACQSGRAAADVPELTQVQPGAEGRVHPTVALLAGGAAPPVRRLIRLTHHHLNLRLSGRAIEVCGLQGHDGRAGGLGGDRQRRTADARRHNVRRADADHAVGPTAAPGVAARTVVTFTRSDAVMFVGKLVVLAFGPTGNGPTPG